EEYFYGSYTSQEDLIFVQDTFSYQDPDGRIGNGEITYGELKPHRAQGQEIRFGKDGGGPGMEERKREERRL
ncbi:hypothetical protein KI387_006400, partial [Taxus chinensis]